MRESEDKRGHSDKRERESGTREERFNRRDSEDREGVQSAEWRVRGQSDEDGRWWMERWEVMSKSNNEGHTMPWGGDLETFMKAVFKHSKCLQLFSTLHQHHNIFEITHSKKRNPQSQEVEEGTHRKLFCVRHFLTGALWLSTVIWIFSNEMPHISQVKQQRVCLLMTKTWAWEVQL